MSQSFIDRRALGRFSQTLGIASIKVQSVEGVTCVWGIVSSSLLLQHNTAERQLWEMRLSSYINKV